MAVRAADRKMNDMQVIRYGDDLVREVVRILSSENIFPKRSRWIFGDSIMETARNFYVSMHLANELKPLTANEANERRLYMVRGFSYLKTLDAIMTFAADVHGVAPSKIERFSGNYIRVYDLYQGWLRRENNTYKAKWPKYAGDRQ